MTGRDEFSDAMWKSYEEVCDEYEAWCGVNRYPFDRIDCVLWWIQASVRLMFVRKREERCVASMKIKCNHCGKPVSTEVPEGTVVLGDVVCPECLARRQEG